MLQLYQLVVIILLMILAIGLRIDLDLAEEVKIKHANLKTDTAEILGIRS